MAPSSAFPVPIELVYKELDGIQIAMDVYIPENATKEVPVPVLVWWHAGGLVTGTRRGLSPHMLHMPAKYNLCIVSVDYRLAPQIHLPEILSDCKSALDFLNTETFAKATRDCVDTSRVVVSGSSAGGWLALLAGTGIGYEASGVERPKEIKGIVALYPITDILDPFWSTKQRPVVFMDRIIEESEVVAFMDTNSTTLSWSMAESNRGFVYRYCLQEGIFKQVVLGGTGIDPGTYSIAQNVRTGKFSTPPTYIAVGNGDTRVPYRQSLDVAKAFKSVAAYIDYNELDGLDHLFDTEDKYDMEDLYRFVKSVL
ncbi:alpha/beta-hydrolase [Macrolepiota fuliginosa MF-IS2]|uniref:Alpha/beta-hydrolase n=1 Tax=Macrolepiota fuliginosa MF-IS2 TaxID=1400762 RepID=A0A9P5X6E6_9AGAR|nr:alpha/beta-hydrolase [Macrolepiota fuliginosa MF-IS2]